MKSTASCLKLYGYYKVIKAIVSYYKDKLLI